MLFFGNLRKLLKIGCRSLLSEKILLLDFSLHQCSDFFETNQTVLICIYRSVTRFERFFTEWNSWVFLLHNFFRPRFHAFFTYTFLLSVHAVVDSYSNAVNRFLIEFKRMPYLRLFYLVQNLLLSKVFGNFDVSICVCCFLHVKVRLVVGLIRKF